MTNSSLQIAINNQNYSLRLSRQQLIEDNKKLEELIQLKKWYKEYHATDTNVSLYVWMLKSNKNLTRFQADFI